MRLRLAFVAFCCVVLIGFVAVGTPTRTLARNINFTLDAPGNQSAGQATVQAATNPKLGSILTDAQGMTLYTLDTEVTGSTAGGNIRWVFPLHTQQIVCAGKCLSFWPPLTLPTGLSMPKAGPGVPGYLGVVVRPDGIRQVTYNGYPLYHFVGDKKPGDTNGNGIKAPFGTWSVATPSTGM